MKAFRLTTPLVALVLAVSAFSGCGKHDGGGGHEPEHEESPSGASFKPGKGVLLTEETRKILDLQTVDVTEQRLPAKVRLNLQVFGEVHRHGLRPEDHSGCDVHGSAFLSDEDAAAVRAGLPVEVQSRSNGMFHGLVLDIRKETAIGESEVIVGISNATKKLPPGEFLTANIALPREAAVRVVPRSALLRTSEGNFVYTVNGDAFFRTAVSIGGEGDGWLEITDGLLEGDTVVTRPVQTLYLIELRATKGGGHSH